MNNYSTFIVMSLVLLLWGSAFPAIRAALNTYTPTHLAALRFFIASVALGLMLWKKGAPKLERKDIPFFFINGVVGVGFYNLFLNNGQRTVDSGVASLLVNTAPLWTALWSVFFLRERFTVRTGLGMFISFLGVALVTIKTGHTFQLNRGAFLVLGASVAHSIYIVLMKRNVTRYGALAATTWAVWAGTFFLFFFSNGLISAVRTAPLSATLIVVYLGLFPAAVAYVLWGVVLNRMPASKAVSFLFFVPVTAFLIGWAWLRENPSSTTFCGGILILIGVAIVNRTRPNTQHPVTTI